MAELFFLQHQCILDPVQLHENDAAQGDGNENDEERKGFLMHAVKGSKE